MPFAKGTPKPIGSGRRKGGGNKASVIAILAEYNCDPIEGMIRLAQDPKNKPQLRARVFAELAQYRWPKLRAIELSGPGGGPMEVASVSPAELLARRIDSIASRIGKKPDLGGSLERAD